MASDPRVAARNELVLARRNTATARTEPPQHRKRRRDTATLAVPFAASTAIAATALAVGVLLGSRLPLLAVLGCGGAVIVAVDFAVARNGLAGRDRTEVMVAALFAVLLAVGAATGISGRVVLMAVAVVAASTARVAAHPAMRARRDRDRQAESRAAYLAGLEEEFPEAATNAGWPHLGLLRILDDGVGHTYEVSVGRDRDLTGLSKAVNRFTIALGVEAGRVTIEENRRWLWLATIHVREDDPQLTADDLEGAAVDSIVDPLPIGPYVDGKTYHSRLFVPDHGATDLLLAGSMGGGKSSWVWRLFDVLRSAPDVAWIVADGATGRDFASLDGKVFRYVAGPAEFLDLLRTLPYFIANRNRVLGDNGWGVWRPSAANPLVVVVVEEVREWAASAQAGAIQALLEEIIGGNRAPGVAFLLLSQESMGKGVFSPRLRRKLAGRVQFAMNEAGDHVLKHHTPRPEVFDTAGDGAFIAETKGENRRLPARAVWLPRNARNGIAEEMVAHNAFPEDEWADAEAARRLAGSSSSETSDPVPTVSDGGVIEGKVVADRPTIRPGIVLAQVLPSVERPALSDSEADRRFWEDIEKAGAAGLTRTQVQELTGKKKTWAGDLLRAAVTSNRVVQVGTGRSTRYVLVEYATQAA